MTTLPSTKLACCACLLAALLARGGWAESPRPVRTIKDAGGYAVFSPDGKRIVANVSGKTWRATDVRMWEVASGKQLLTLQGHESGIWRLAFDRDGSRLVTNGHDKVIMIWDVRALVSE